MAEERIVDKIVKLLELADETRGGTPAERENATKRAHEMMLKYNVEQAEIDGRSAEGDVGEDSFEIKGTQDEWKVKLPILLGGACFVGGYYQPLARFKWRVILVGRAENIAFVRALCDQLIPWLEAEAAVAFGYAVEGGDAKPRSFKRAFYYAATVTILARLQAEREEITGNGMELVRTEDAANSKYIEDTAGPVKTQELRGYSSIAGRMGGEEAGLRADLATPQGKAVDG